MLWEPMEGRREEGEMKGEEEAAVNTLSPEGRGTGTVSGGLAGAPSLALQTLAFISGQKVQEEEGRPCVTLSPQLDVMSHKTDTFNTSGLLFYNICF